MEISFWSYLNSNILIITKFCIWHDNTAVMVCAKMCSDQMSRNGFTTKWMFHPIWMAIRAPSKTLFPISGPQSSPYLSGWPCMDLRQACHLDALGVFTKVKESNGWVQQITDQLIVDLKPTYNQWAYLIMILHVCTKNFNGTAWIVDCFSLLFTQCMHCEIQPILMMNSVRKSKYSMYIHKIWSLEDADRRCSNYINNQQLYCLLMCMSYIRGLTVVNIIAADDMETQGAMATVPMVLA